MRRGKQYRTMDGVLAVLRRFFDEASFEEREKFWSVLTGLRGPDRGGLGLKEATTAVIRYHAVGPGTLGITNSDNSCRRRRRMKIGRSDTHFHQHARQAFVALGLKWSETN